MISTTLLPAELAAGQSTDVVLQIRNIGTVPCITVVLEFEPPRSLIIERGRRAVEIDRLDPGAQHDHPIRLRAVEPGRISISVPNFSFRDSNGRAHHDHRRTIDVDVRPAPSPPVPRPPAQLPPRWPVTATSSVFISHRTSESEWFVDLLADRLSAEFSWQRVFVDRNSMRPGEDFMVRIDAELRRCAAMLVLIGPQWSTVKCADGRRRIDCDDDVVRYEIERALERGVLVIPVLFEGARMPSRADLPDEIRALANRHAKRVDPDHLDHDLEIIVSGLKPLLDA